MSGFRTSAGPPTPPPAGRRASVTSTYSPTAAKDLLEQVTKRLNDDYRFVRFPGRPGSTNYEQRVSFDTIDVQAADDDPLLDFSDDDAYTSMRNLINDLDPGRARGRGRELLVPSGPSPVRSPSLSPTRMLSPIRGMDMLAFFKSQIPYPTRPLITHRGCMFTRMHKDFEKLYLGELATRPVLPRRVILVYISGRKHTWVSLDWILGKFIENGDTVIVVSAINHRLAAPASRLTKYPSPQRYIPRAPKVRQRQRNRPEFIKEIASDIMDYCTRVVNPEVIAKITVEIAEGKTKDVLRDMYKLYEPNIFTSGSKVNPRNSAPLKSWLSSRLTDRMVKNFPLPVIVVPALNMGPFEETLQNATPMSASSSASKAQSDSSHKSHQSEVSHPHSGDVSTKMSIIRDQADDADDSDMGSLSSGSVRSDSSAGSTGSSRSWTSFDEIAELYDAYREDLRNNIGVLVKKEHNNQFYANFAKVISDKSLQFCDDIRGVNPDFKGKGAVLARAITGSNSFGNVPYKTKSLLAPVGESKPARSGSPSMSYSELKRSLQAKSALGAGASVPQITVEGTSPLSLSPALTRPSALKFQDPDVPPKRRGTSLKTKKLTKFLSYEDLSSSRLNIEPSKSHPDIRGVMSGESEKKKKKKKKSFWKLF